MSERLRMFECLNVLEKNNLHVFSDCINITVDSIVSTIKKSLIAIFLLTIPLEKSQLTNFKKNDFFETF